MSRDDETVLHNLGSKHLVHAAGDRRVVYSGTCRVEIQDEIQVEGHLEKPVFVLDNDSGSYAPDYDR